MWLSVENLANPLLLVLATPFILKNLGTEQFGYYVYINACIGISAAFSFGTLTTFVPFLSKKKIKDYVCLLDQISSVGVVLYVPLIVVLSVLILAADNIGWQFSLPIIACIAVSIFFDQLDNRNIVAFRALERYGDASKIEVLSRLLQTFLIIMGILCIESDLRILILVQLFVSILKYFIKTIVLNKFLPEIKIGFAFNITKKNLLSVLPSWTQACIASLTMSMDRIVVANSLGSSALSEYAIASMIPQQLQGTFAAAMASLLSKRTNFTKSSAIRLLCVTLAGCLLIFMILNAIDVDLFTIWFGRDFDKHFFIVFNWILIFNLILMVTAPSYFLLMRLGRGRSVTIIISMASIIGLLIIVIGVRDFGLYGVLLGKTIFSIISLLQVFLLIKILPKK
jgi:O-antigen/teichoic acid export membrane protein